jgi:hypothetical protein
MRGHHNPIGWAATMLIAVAYAHVLLELSAAVLAVAVAVRLLLSPARGVLCERAHRCRPLVRGGRVMVLDRRSAHEADRRPHSRLS